MACGRMTKVKIFDSPYKPTSNQVVARIQQYEEKNEIAPYKKISKIMKAACLTWAWGCSRKKKVGRRMGNLFAQSC